MPIVSFIGLVTNLIALFIIFHPKNREIFKENKRTFQYFAFNSIFSIFDCILSSLTLISECMGVNSFYCSPILVQAQYLRIYGVAYFSEIMKACSLLTMLTFSLERYKLASNSENFILKRIAKIHINFLLTFYFLFASLFSANKIFELKSDDISLHKYNIELPVLLVHFNHNHSDQYWLIPIHWIHYILFSFFISIAIILFDTLLIKQTKIYLGKKKELFSKILKESNGKNKEAKKQLAEIKKTSKKSKKLFWYQIITFVLFKLPELIIYSYLASPWFPEIEMASLGLTLVNLAKFLYLFSYSTNLLFYYKFNTAFKKAFQNIFQAKKTI